MKSLTWTDKQRAIAGLADQGKEFLEIVDLGFSKTMASRVLRALKAGQKPTLKPEGGVETETETKGETKPLVAVAGPKSAPIIYRIDQKQIALDPLELNRQYSFYADLIKDNDDMKYSFSEVLTIGIQIVWFLQQDIPHTENMLRALLYGYQY